METKQVSCVEAGRRGGSARTAKKVAASRENARKARETRLKTLQTCPKTQEKALNVPQTER